MTADILERASSPASQLLGIVTLRHPSVADPVRLINDPADRVIGGDTYLASRFELRLIDESEGRAPTASIEIANIGRPLFSWIEETQGGVGGTATIGEVLAATDTIAWEITLDLQAPVVETDRIGWQIGFDPILGRPAVAVRFDPATAPGLF